MPASIDLKNIRKSYGDTEVIKGIDLSIDPGEFVVLVGPSGCGKSTLLRMIAGLETISSGDLFFDQDRVNDWAPAKRKVGMVFQSYALYPHMSVAENVGFGLKLAKTDKTEREVRVKQALEVLQLDHLAERKPAALSGGQRQRVAIGRAIVRRPNVFLFDEPLSNLDTALRVDMRMEIGKLHRRLKNTVVYVTHDQVEAMTLADKIVVLEGGHVRQVGRPMDLYNKPENKFVAGFMGTPKMGFLDAKLQSAENGKLRVSLLNDMSIELDIPQEDRKIPSNETICLGIRPEHCELGAAGDCDLTGEVLELERLGSETFAFLEINGAEAPFAMRVGKGKSVKAGDVVGVHVDTTHTHIFSSNGEAIMKTH